MERYIYRHARFVSEGTERISIILVLAANKTCVDLIMAREGPVRLKLRPNLTFWRQIFFSNFSTPVFKM